MSLPYDYYPAVLYAINLISEGRTETDACDESNISITVFRSYVNKSPEIQEMLAEAEQRSYDALADALITIDRHKIHGQSDSKMAKVISDNIKWFLDKRARKKYGQQVQVDVNITADKAITDALAAGRKRAALAYVDEAEFIDITPVVDMADEALMAEMGLV